jgi:putative addiction module component (TIGR02574 family)
LVAFFIEERDNSHMDTQAQQILQTALALPHDDRVEIAESLILSLDDEAAVEIEEAWAIEINRRLESIDRGEVKMIPMEEVMREMRERLNGCSAD